ncbi:MAG: leucine-rich repeat protein [Oscillospiraceae bacterium]|nr:leucine-rich repeat protein [Oscillospiraceae bacterium]
MKTTKITSLLTACAMLTGTAAMLPTMPDSAIVASAEETEGYTESTYELLTYRNYGDHIMITDCDDFATKVEIPAEIDGLPVTEIGEYAFYGIINLSSITIPDSVTSIGYGAFRECKNLTSVIIPDGVTKIGESTFYECKKLTSVTIPDSVTSIDAEAFYNCASLTDVTIPDAVTSIAEAAFCNCKSLTSITIPDGVTTIENNVFSGCDALGSVSIPDSVITIGGNAFSGCASLTDVTIPDGVTSIGSSAFSETAWLAVKQAENPMVVVNGILIDSTACEGKTVIPDGVTRIGDWSFSRNTAVTSITIPNSVTCIGIGAFELCENLTDVYYSGTEEDWKAITIADENEILLNATIHFAESEKPSVTPGDLNGDGMVNANDAALILMYAAYSGAGGELDIMEFIAQL